VFILPQSACAYVLGAASKYDALGPWKASVLVHRNVATTHVYIYQEALMQPLDVASSAC
jgi:hypothetical protein